MNKKNQNRIVPYSVEILLKLGKNVECKSTHRLARGSRVDGGEHSINLYLINLPAAFPYLLPSPMTYVCYLCQHIRSIHVYTLLTLK